MFIYIYISRSHGDEREEAPNYVPGMVVTNMVPRQVKGVFQFSLVVHLFLLYISITDVHCNVQRKQQQRYDLRDPDQVTHYCCKTKKGFSLEVEQGKSKKAVFLSPNASMSKKKGVMGGGGSKL